MYSSDLAACEPSVHNVKEGSFIDLENSAGGIYIVDISNSGVHVSREPGKRGWKLREGPNSMGNCEHLTVTSYDGDSKTATIRQIETDRRGFGGAFAF